MTLNLILLFCYFGLISVYKRRREDKKTIIRLSYKLRCMPNTHISILIDYYAFSFLINSKSQLCPHLVRFSMKKTQILNSFMNENISTFNNQILENNKYYYVLHSHSSLYMIENNDHILLFCLHEV